MNIHTIGTPGVYAGFMALVFAVMALDLLLFHRKTHEAGFRQAVLTTALWICAAAAFNLFVYARFGKQPAMEFVTGYLIEESLSIDNVFIFLLIFSHFKVPFAYQHRVLFWGFLGAVVFRGIFIFVGVALLTRFHWMLWIFGVFLLVTGFKLLFEKEKGFHPEDSRIYRLFKKFVPMTHEFRHAALVTVENGKRYATPLLLVLIIVEVTDLIFAMDSIPAVFAVTHDPFIVFASNILAVAGLRALFFLLASGIGRFHLLRIGLALVLIFVGAKMAFAEFFTISIGASLAIVAGLIGGSLAASLHWPKQPSRAAPR